MTVLPDRQRSDSSLVVTRSTGENAVPCGVMHALPWAHMRAEGSSWGVAQSGRFARGVHVQGVQLVGRPEEGASLGCEGAPAALLDRVSAFLAQERARLRSNLDACKFKGKRSCLRPPLHCGGALTWTITRMCRWSRERGIRPTWTDECHGREVSDI